MNYIKSLHIEGFKKFVSLDVQFNERMNILVGENEAGKSTILNALKTVLNQQYRNTDKSVLRDLFNTQMVAVFKEKPSVKTLPRIYIEVELALDPQQKDASYFYGEVYGQRKQQFEKYGTLIDNYTDNKNIWTIVVHRDKEKLKLVNSLVTAGIDRKRIRTIPSGEFFDLDDTAAAHRITELRYRF